MLPEAVGRPNRHKDYAAFDLGLQHELNEVGDDEARKRLQGGVRRLLKERKQPA